MRKIFEMLSKRHLNGCAYHCTDNIILKKLKPKAMKKLMFVMLASLLIMFGCSKDDPVMEENDNSVSSENLKCKPLELTLPLKVWFSSIPDFSTPPVQCLPAEFGNVVVGGGGWIKGFATYIGKVNVDNSPWSTTGCNFGPNPGQVTQYIQGKITGANGHYFLYSGHSTATFADASLTGEMTINGGTGRFANATGTVTINGTVNFETGAATWTGRGTITFHMKH
jgi:hypothetical protein